VTALGRPRAHHRVTGSTNERAKELARAGAPHGTLVTADEQTAGRGRQGRSWLAPSGSAVLMSLVLRELEPGIALAPLAAAVAVCEAAEASAPGIEGRVKWPNDVWVEGRKLAGILIEGRPQEGWAVLGIGLNVTATELPEELREIATSLALAARVGGSRDPATAAAAPAAPSPEAVLARLIAALERWLVAPPTEVLEAWRARDALRGHGVRWTGGDGTAAGIDDDGSLLVDTTEGRLALGAGEVHLERPR
jgi:BirA family biotin operon repressor/biotin-[acetyl-CoA-carboxylase] ligase